MSARRWRYRYGWVYLARPKGRALPHGCDPVTAHSAVSILTRPEGRALLLHILIGNTRVSSFNPHPSRRTGATRSAGRVLFGDKVSILTRPEGRALQEAWSIIHTVLSFQSSPVPKDGRY